MFSMVIARMWTKVTVVIVQSKVIVATIRWGTRAMDDRTSPPPKRGEHLKTIDLLCQDSIKADRRRAPKTYFVYSPASRLGRLFSRCIQDRKLNVQRKRYAVDKILGATRNQNAVSQQVAREWTTITELFSIYSVYFLSMHKSRPLSRAPRSVHVMTE